MGSETSVPAEPTPSHQLVMVAAIDFGTTYSGYAFAFNDEPKNIILNRNWGSELSTSSLKTPTSVLINQKGEFLSFGYKAEYDYANICSDRKTEQFELYRHFKMTLYNKTIKRSTMVRSVRGKEFSIMKLTVYTLRFLKQHLLDEVSKFNREPDDRRIKWILTVPAIWHEDAKQFMREAAFQAGLIKEQCSDRLIMALEPEAASVFCRGLNVYDFNNEFPKVEVTFEKGTKYLIADIGGGTLDITAHEIRNEKELVEIMSANGGELGGMKLNDSFENLLQDILSEAFVQHLKEKYPTQWLKLMMKYEYKKRDVTAVDNEGIDVGISLFIKNEFKSYTGKELEDVINTSDIPGISYCRGVIDIEPTNVQKLFDPVIDNIISCIDEAIEIELLQDLKYLIIVGGFGDSGYLLHKIKKAFSNRCSIISPYAASSVILKGAVFFGHNPSTIISRICRKTYGIEIHTKFVEGKHNELKKYKKQDGTLMAKDVFKPYVMKGEQVSVGTFKTHTLTSAKRNINISIYCTDRTDVIHTDEDGVTKLDDLSLEKPFFKWLFSFSSVKTIESRIYFGKTEITVDVEDTETHQIVKTSIDFLKE